MSAGSTDLVALLVLSLLTIFAGVRHWQSSRIATAFTERSTDNNGDDDPNKNRRCGGEQLGPLWRHELKLMQMYLGCAAAAL